MTVRISAEGRRALACLRAHLDDPAADVAAAERAGAVPDDLLAALAADRLLLPTFPVDRGGLGLSQQDLGALCEELGGRWMSLLSVLTAHMMAAEAILRWGRGDHVAGTLAGAARGDVLLSFALSEPDAGSDTAAIGTKAVPDGPGYRLTGRKTWLSGGQRAERFLVLARSDAGPLAALVDRRTPGLLVTPVAPLLGFRAAMLSTVELNDVEVPVRQVLAGPGRGLTHVAATALDHGRFCLGWGAVGVAQSSLRACADHVHSRRQFGVPLLEHQLVRRTVTDTMVRTNAARSLCAQAATLRDERSPDAPVHTSMAKYFAAQVAAQASRDAVQLHGALGASQDSPVERYFRDAKLLEIVEGTEQIHQMTIAGHVRRFANGPFAAADRGGEE